MLDVTDVWRKLNPYTVSHTHVCQRYNVCTRIDKFYISSQILREVNSARIIPFAHSDHHAVTCKITCQQTTKGPGVWHLNTSILNDREYKKQIETFWEMWTNQKEHIHDIALWWDIGKSKIKTITQKYCSLKKQEEQAERKTIETRLLKLVNSDNIPPNLAEEINILKAQIKELDAKEIEGAAIRSKIQWREQGETNSRFFCSLEKKNGNDKTFDKIKTENGHLVTDIDDILSEQVKFYTKLYTKENIDPYAQNILLSNITMKLDTENQDKCEGNITQNECEKALSETSNGKSPGSDGIPYEFYKEFWYLLKHDFIQVINYVYESGLLSPSQRRGMITLLFKKGERENLANWRPITLLNSDYKIISKILANRLKSVLPCVINEDQTCGIPGRTINSNLSLLRDIVNYTNSEKIPAAIICLDQLKAFDRVDWNFIYRTLSAMNFGPNFIKWVRILYTDISSSIKCNGFVSGAFNPRRGVRQGYPLSTLLNCIVAEVMAEAIRNESK